MIPAIILLLVVVALRVLVPFAVDAGEGGGSILWNFSPLAAIALCGAFVMPRRWAVAFPLAALFLSDLALNAYYGADMLGGWLWVRYAVLLVIAMAGVALHKHVDLRKASLLLFPASLAGSVFFFLATNTASWMTQPLYAKTLSGWIQALTVGLPGFPPTWVFFRNSLVSDLLFTGLFVLCLAWGTRTARAELPAGDAAVSRA